MCWPMTENCAYGGNLAIRSYMLQKRKKRESMMEFFARKKLLWDGENMRITNLEEANQFVTQEIIDRALLVLDWNIRKLSTL